MVGYVHIYNNKTLSATMFYFAVARKDSLNAAILSFYSYRPMHCSKDHIIKCTRALRDTI